MKIYTKLFGILAASLVVMFVITAMIDRYGMYFGPEGYGCIIPCGNAYTNGGGMTFSDLSGDMMLLLTILLVLLTSFVRKIKGAS